MKILVTGVVGLLGRGRRTFCNDGTRSRWGRCLTDYYSRALKEINLVDVVTRAGYRYICDLAVDDLNHIMKGFDVVFHFLRRSRVFQRGNLI